MKIEFGAGPPWDDGMEYRIFVSSAELAREKSPELILLEALIELLCKE